MAVEVGIDLGTTNTVVQMKSKDGICNIPVDNEPLLPSVFYKSKKKDIELVGGRAKTRGLMDPQNYIKSTKRSMDSNEKKFHVSDESFSAEDIAVKILLKAKEAIYKYLGHEDEIEAVITVPNNFSINAVENTKKAGERAGFVKVEILKEPIAAVLAYGEQLQLDKESLYFVSDFGGGTLDIAVIRYDDEKYEVIATGGNDRLGGDDFTQAMLHYFYNIIVNNEKYRFLDFSLDQIEDSDILKNIFDTNNSFQKAKARLLEKAEQAKIELSMQHQTHVEIPRLFIYNGEAVDFECDVTLDDYKQYFETQRLLLNFKEAVEDVIFKLNNSNIQVTDLSHVIYVGGSMNLPFAKEIIHELLPIPTLDDNLDTVVAIGAASKFGVKKQRKKIIPKLNYNLGVKVKDDKFSVIIENQTIYPVEKYAYYTTNRDNQTELDFEVFEGNVLKNVYDPKNHALGFLTISDIVPREEGVPRIKVTFSINEEGILKITAFDEDNKNEVHTEIRI